MAGVENIKLKILQDAELKASEILDKARLQAKEIEEKVNDKAALRTKEISQKYEYSINEKKRIINSNVELEMRKDILSAKQQSIDEAFDRALERLNNLDKEEYEQIILDMIIATAESGEEELVMSEDRKNNLSPDFMKKANKALKAVGKKGNLKLSDNTRSISGGFILESNGVEINNSFGAVIRLYRDEIEPKVAEIFFNE